ncbi:MAG: ATP-grasp domain-containing protein [Synergistaceae bacterium]|nr:ATP-grasp domain-containing protein [Synergistaceae bacterium]
MKQFEGKKLLILGSNTMAPEIVEYAKENGAYTIVTDYLPIEKSNAKKIADEVLNISTADTDKLVLFCRENNVNGVFAGISEFNLLQAYEISRQLGLRFYFDMEQWCQIEKKDQFRDLCSKNNVNAPQKYFSGTEKEYELFNNGCLTFPVVIKPVDGSSSQGVTICNDKKTLQLAVKNAFGVSVTKKIIIEQFVYGYEFTAHYVICNGKAALSCVDNRYPVSIHEGNVTTIPIARVYPALFQDLYEREINAQILALCESVGLKNAVLFVQGIFNENERKFYIFEAGLRSAGEAPCRFIERITDQNHFFMLLDYILLGKTNYDLQKEQPKLGGKCCATISFAAKGGIVGNIIGVDSVIKEIPQIVQFENRYPVGSETPNGDTLRQLMLRFVIISESREELASIVELLNKKIQVEDVQGNNMVVTMDPWRVFGLV